MNEGVLYKGMTSLQYEEVWPVYVLQIAEREESIAEVSIEVIPGF